MFSDSLTRVRPAGRTIHIPPDTRLPQQLSAARHHLAISAFLQALGVLGRPAIGNDAVPLAVMGPFAGLLVLVAGLRGQGDNYERVPLFCIECLGVLA
jgi:hypothetical protein